VGWCCPTSPTCFTDTGDIETAKAFFDESIAIARDTGDRVAEGLRLGNLGWFYIVTGRYTEAVDTLEHALKISEKKRRAADRGGPAQQPGAGLRPAGRPDSRVEPASAGAEPDRGQ
jgi:tetratricopeptide (TPR) repeat protein